MRRTILLLAVAALALTGLTACGGDTEGSREDPDLAVQGVNIAAADLPLVIEAEERFAQACGEGRQTDPGAGKPLDQAVDDLIDVHRRDPEGIYAPNEADRQRSMNDVLTDNAERLEGCGEGDAAARLREAVEQQGG